MNTARLLSSAIGLAVAVAAFPAMAQDSDAPIATDTPARDSHFDGPYVQAFGGLSTRGNDGGDSLRFDTDGDGRYDNTVNTAAGANAFSPGFCNGRALGATPDGGCRSDKDGAEYGVRFGYDKRMGNNFVLGGLVEGVKSDAKDATSGYSTTPASYTIQRKLDYGLSARVRAGYTPGGGALFYVTGGGGVAKLDHSFLTTNTANSFDPQRNNKLVWGWQAGGGGEIMVARNVSLGLEYLYNRYNDNKYNVEVGPGTAPATNPFLIDSGSTNIKGSNKDFSYHSLRATVGFQF
ncbi:outer membrane immunogenic protein [Novosphingobium sp. PhB57]|jgi:outer membrane immunogenic protein|uniref:outer membrane protein n=1 Tax=unclassified Novosphingobium TaxID=2644732 RepID=UPI001047969A|nr:MULTISPECIES: porin family protein [unclassified Novosphingobium]TCU59800.1 outer membrane immunogenic protein [Novosphingobium sp. PhB57]TDW62621.1 outer membrane immunogenic protein [Novosphingobium sp. PhB55]